MDMTRGESGRNQPGNGAVGDASGIAPGGFQLPADTTLGTVRLRVADLARSIEFYQAVLGMRVLERDAKSASLGAQRESASVVELIEEPGIAPASRRGRLGLYHYAVLLPDRAALGRFMRHVSDLGMIPGAADHLVSEALYLQDPDGLGIEVYADRPRDTWRHEGGEIAMATAPLDVDALLDAAGDERWRGMPVGTAIGHVHLHVGELSEARGFFSGALGFLVTTASYPGALFFGAGRYHHHVGTNTWAGAGARPTRADEAGLVEWTIELPDAASLDAAANNISAAGHDITRAGSGVVTTDPWGTAVRLRVR